MDPTHPGVVAGKAGRLADAHLSELLGVIGDRCEIQRAGELHCSQPPALRVVGLDAQRLTSGEAIGVPGRVARPLGAGVMGEGGVDVGVTEEGPPQRIVVWRFIGS